MQLPARNWFRQHEVDLFSQRVPLTTLRLPYSQTNCAFVSFKAMNLDDRKIESGEFSRVPHPAPRSTSSTVISPNSDSSANWVNSAKSPKLEPVEMGLKSAGRGPTEFYCPRCQDRVLEVGLMGQVEVCYCDRCRGILIDSSTLGPLLTALRADYRGPDSPPRPLDQKALVMQIVCTVCHQPMETHPYCGPGPVVLNSCRHCQTVWMDRGELSAIIRAPGNRSTF